MNDKPTNGELAIMIENLCDKITTGFSGVYIRQDATNGNVIKNTEFRISSIATFKTIKWVVGFFGVGTVVNVILSFSNFAGFR